MRIDESCGVVTVLIFVYQTNHAQTARQYAHFFRLLPMPNAMPLTQRHHSYAEYHNALANSERCRDIASDQKDKKKAINQTVLIAKFFFYELTRMNITIDVTCIQIIFIDSGIKWRRFEVA